MKYISCQQKKCAGGLTEQQKKERDRPSNILKYDFFSLSLFLPSKRILAGEAYYAPSAMRKN